MTPSLVRFIDSLYMGWFGSLFMFFFWASWSSERVLRQRALVAFVLIWIAAGTATAWLHQAAAPATTGRSSRAPIRMNNFLSVSTQSGQSRAN